MGKGHNASTPVTIMGKSIVINIFPYKQFYTLQNGRLVTHIFSFSHNVFKGIPGLCSKGLRQG